MKSRYPFLCGFLLAMAQNVFANETFDKISKLNDSAAYNQATLEAKLYLQTHPHDGDMQFLLAKTYYLSVQNLKAIETLKHLLSEYPNYKDARLLLSRLYIKNHDYGKAFDLINEGLSFAPEDKEFNQERINILSDICLGPPYLSLSKMYDKGLKQQAIQKGEDYLKVYPNDADVGLVLARLYVKEGQYEKARQLLISYIYRYPGYTDVYLLLVNIDIHLQHLAEGKTMASLGLIYTPWDIDLAKKVNDLNYLLAENTQKKLISKKLAFNPYVGKRVIQAVPEPVAYKNEVTIFQQNYYITDVKKVWDYTSVFYGRQTKMGKLYGKINYANRLNREALQYEMEFFPKINKYLYLDLDASVANQPILFPHYSYGGELFVVLPHLFNPSFGAQLNRIDSKHMYSRFTTSISKDISLSNLTFRPYFYFPGKGGSSILYTLNYRYNFAEPYGYMGFIIGSGTTPDLANLETVNFIILKNKLISPYINFALMQDRLVLNLSLLYQNQIFPNERIRDWLGGTLGATWKF